MVWNGLWLWLRPSQSITVRSLPISYFNSTLLRWRPTKDDCWFCDRNPETNRYGYYSQTLSRTMPPSQRRFPGGASGKSLGTCTLYNQHLAQRGSPTFDRPAPSNWSPQYLSKQFTALYNPSKNVAVDEAMIKFQGRFGPLSNNTCRLAWAGTSTSRKKNHHVYSAQLRPGSKTFQS